MRLSGAQRAGRHHLGDGGSLALWGGGRTPVTGGFMAVFRVCRVWPAGPVTGRLWVDARLVGSGGVASRWGVRVMASLPWWTVRW